jgi:iron complex outermembrane recepter protein
MSFKPLLLASAALIAPSIVVAQTTPAPPSRPVTAPSPNDDDTETVVVTAQRGKNSVQGDAVPETTLAPQDIRALGASNITEILASLGPRAGTGRGRGGGFPVVLLNGRRVSGFAEIRNIPSEAIVRVEVFPEATALQYGFSAEQRVVNFILRERFRAVTLEGSLGLGADGDRSEDNPEINYLRITEKGRILANAEITKSNAVTEAQRGIIRTSGLADSAFRTVLPETFTSQGSLTYVHGLSSALGATFDARFDTTEFESLLGLRAPSSGEAPLTRNARTVNTRFATTLDGATKGWQWTASASLDNSDSNTRTELAVGPLQIAKAETQVAEFIANGSGALFKLPAGQVRASLRTGYLERQLDSVSVRGGVTTTGSLSRGDTTTRMTLSVPITSRRGNFGAAFGDITVSANGGFTDLSDFGQLQSTGYGLTWAPFADLRFSANVDSVEAAPSIQQLGNPVIATPNSPVFDYVTGQTVLVTRTSGGNINLRQESRDDVTFAVNYAPAKFEGLDINVSWARNKSENPVGSLSGLTPDLEAAFSDRFSRVNGRLIAIDQRGVNFAASQNEVVRYGFSYGRSFGKTLAQLIASRGGPPFPIPPVVGTQTGGPPTGTPQSGGPPSGGRPQGGGPPAGGQRQAGGGGGGFGPPGGFGGFGGFGGGGGGGGGPPTGPLGRWSFSIFHTIRLEDSVTLRAGGQSLDLLEGAAIDDNGGARRHLIEAEGGASYLGMGFRLNGSWRSGTKITGTGTDLIFDDIFNVNARFFFSLEARPDIVRKARWLRRSRLVLRVDNLTDSFQRVTDSAGNTPEAYQRGYIAPRGRFVELAWRKQF